MLISKSCHSAGSKRTSGPPSMRARSLLSVGSLLMLIGLTAPSRAAWRSDGTPFAPVPTAVVASDARGGAYAAVEWPDHFTILHRIDASGDSVAGWSALGVELTPGMRYVDHNSIAPIGMLPDGEGGSFTLVAEQFPYQGSGGFLYPVQFFVHRRTADGSPARGWTRDGVRLDAEWLEHRYETHHLPTLASDGRGGVLVAWLGQDAGPATPALAVQRVTAAGALPWGDAALRVQSSPGACTIPAVAADGHGGALVFWGRWNDAGTRIAIVGQHVSAQGRVWWGATGRQVSRQTFRNVADAVPADGGWVWAMYAPALCALPDGEGGAIVAWAAANDSMPRVRAARIRGNGRLRWRDDAILSSAPGNAGAIVMTPLARDAIALAWLEARDATIQVRAQVLSNEGRARWTSDGVPVASGGVSAAHIVHAPQQGLYVAWGDSSGAVRAQRLRRNGMPAMGWPASGTLVATASFTESAPLIAGLVESSDRSAIVVWNDPVRGALARRVLPSGLESARHTLASLPPSSGTANGALTFALGRLSANPSRGDATIAFTLPSSRPASLEVLDVTGRRIWARDVTSFGIGEHRVTLLDGTHTPSGVYFVRLHQGERTATTRLTILR